jgi:hypothetical protein
LAPFLVLIAALSTVYTVLYNHTQGSLLLAVLLHASTDIVPRIVRIAALSSAAWWLIAGLILISGAVLHMAVKRPVSDPAAMPSKRDAGQA